ncbi:MAG: twin-arginine translocation signal domain-containing protein, partial [Enterorhabdus sp.]|nr:twin-arginine translocation signal domain-containing protein [Enterorhabdus sp.]
MEKTAQTFGGLSRRSFLGLAGVTGVGVALTGCAPAAQTDASEEESLPVTGGEPLDYDT